MKKVDDDDSFPMVDKDSVPTVNKDAVPPVDNDHVPTVDKNSTSMILKDSVSMDDKDYVLASNKGFVHTDIKSVSIGENASAPTVGFGTPIGNGHDYENYGPLESKAGKLDEGSREIKEFQNISHELNKEASYSEGLNKQVSNLDGDKPDERKFRGITFIAEYKDLQDKLDFLKDCKNVRVSVDNMNINSNDCFNALRQDIHAEKLLKNLMLCVTENKIQLINSKDKEPFITLEYDMNVSNDRNNQIVLLNHLFRLNRRKHKTKMKKKKVKTKLETYEVESMKIYSTTTEKYASKNAESVEIFKKSDINNKLRTETNENQDICKTDDDDPETTSKPLLMMNVIPSEMFEEALFVTDVGGKKLAFTLIFPENCKMPITVPVYYGGYINNKDVDEREHNSDYITNTPFFHNKKDKHDPSERRKGL